MCAGPRAHRLAVEHGDLLLFIDDPRWWPEWRPERVTDRRFQEHVQRVRPPLRLLTPRQVGRRFGVGHGTVNGWIHRGLLPGARKFGNWWVPDDAALAGFVPPYERSRAGRRPRGPAWTAAEEAQLPMLLAAGLPVKAIAAAMARSLGSIYGRLARLRGNAGLSAVASEAAA